MIKAECTAWDMSRSKLLRIPASDLSVEEPWLFWSQEPSDALRASLESCGQLEPVLVDAGSTPRLVAGASRVRALQQFGRDVWCLQLGDLDAWDKGRTYLHANAGRERTEGRVVQSLRYFSALNQPERMEEIYSDLGLILRSKPRRIMEAWMTLPVAWDDLLFGGNIPAACAELLVRFAPKDLGDLFRIFENLSWSRGNAVNLLTWVHEICIRDGIDVEHVLRAIDVPALFAAGLSPKDCMSRLGHAVRKLRFPVLCAKEAAFETLAKSVSSGTRWRITQPDQFESGAVDLAIRIGSGEDVERACRDLTAVAAHPSWKEYWSAEG